MTAYMSKGQKTPPLFQIWSQQWENMYSKWIYQTTFSWVNNTYSKGEQLAELGLTHSGQHTSSGTVPAPCVWHGKHSFHLPQQSSPAERGDYDGQATHHQWKHTPHIPKFGFSQGRRSNHRLKGRKGSSCELHFWSAARLGWMWMTMTHWQLSSYKQNDCLQLYKLLPLENTRLQAQPAASTHYATTRIHTYRPAATASEKWMHPNCCFKTFPSQFLLMNTAQITLWASKVSHRSGNIRPWAAFHVFLGSDLVQPSGAMKQCSQSTGLRSSSPDKTKQHKGFLPEELCLIICSTYHLEIPTKIRVLWVQDLTLTSVTLMPKSLSLLL